MNGELNVLQPTTKSDGTAFFRIYLSLDSTQADIEVEVNGKYYSAGWLNSKSKPKPQLSVVESEGEGWKNYSISYADGDAFVPTTVKPCSTNPLCRFVFRINGQKGWKSITGKTLIPITDRTVLQVKIVKALPGVGGADLLLTIPGTNAQSGPHYISAYL
jgi:hypothetical protein